ncbi:MAG: ATP-binding protein [Leptolyngbya sp. IPPAS B-1204]|nr:anti-sigma regulatory factor [Elainella sp. C42_A2020_010]RNJ64949.1 MAG: ATP-binding protein [Leptolyngbya sp. IPPAS B-1204]
MTQSHRLQVNTNLEELAQILDWFNSHYQEKLTRSVLIKSQTILAEAFTNAVRHAHRDKRTETPIEIVVYLHPDQIELQVWDFGPEFDWEQQLKQVQEADPVNAEASGGRGIYLIARLADRFRYYRTPDERNCLQMINDFRTEPVSGQESGIRSQPSQSVSRQEPGVRSQH